MPLLGLLNHAATLPELLSTEKSTTGMSFEGKTPQRVHCRLMVQRYRLLALQMGSVQGHTTTDYLLRRHGGLHIATEILEIRVMGR